MRRASCRIGCANSHFGFESDRSVSEVTDPSLSMAVSRRLASQPAETWERPALHVRERRVLYGKQPGTKLGDPEGSKTKTSVGLFPKNSAAAEIIEVLESGVSELSEKASKRISAETAMRISRTTRTASR